MTKYAKKILEIVEASNSHMTADQIFVELRKTYPAVVLATVYNNLNRLWEEERIRKVSVEGMPDRYDRAERHDHLVCRGCGRLLDVDLGDLTEQLEQRVGRSILSYDLKLLYLCRILMEQTDEDHPLSVQELIAQLAQYDIQAERKSIYDDLDALARFGVDVQCRKGRSPGWFVGGRDFELTELKLLVDAVQSSRFITRKKSDALIRKLERLASVYQARQLQRQVFVSGRIKVMNESIYYNVDKLHAAIASKRAITFQYFDYNMYRQKVFRRNGSRYTVSPYGLIWNNDNYYLVAYDSEHRQMRHYRVDKMAEITVTRLPREGTDEYPAFDIAAYGQKHFGMYSGEEMTVTLRAKSSMAGVVLDRFGLDVILVPDGPDYFTVSIPLVLSPQFFGWLFALEPDVTLTAPARAVEAYRQKLRSALEQA